MVARSQVRDLLSTRMTVFNGKISRKIKTRCQRLVTHLRYLRFVKTVLFSLASSSFEAEELALSEETDMRTDSLAERHHMITAHPVGLISASSSWPPHSDSESVLLIG